MSESSLVCLMSIGPRKGVAVAGRERKVDHFERPAAAIPAISADDVEVAPASLAVANDC